VRLLEHETAEGGVELRYIYVHELLDFSPFDRMLASELSSDIRAAVSDGFTEVYTLSFILFPAVHCNGFHTEVHKVFTIESLLNTIGTFAKSDCES
jgi:hypothetical protein